jgi:FAD-dependent oxidoreductase domain-containing protein 1
MTEPVRRFDVVIAGGGVVGCSTAYFIKTLAPQARVAVVEPDSTYELASSLRAAGGCRVQFSGPENIALSKFGIEFIKGFNERMVVGDSKPEVGWNEGGYLFVVPAGSTKPLEDNVRAQNAAGCEVHLLSPAELRAKFPSMHVGDLGVGAHSPRDGWCDPNALLWGFRKKAASMGVAFIGGRVAALGCDPARVHAAVLADGSRLEAEHFVNAAGAWSGQIAAMAGMHLPIVPMKRYEHFFTVATPIEPLPLVKDLARLAFRPEGRGFSGGLVDGNARRGFNFDVDHEYWERVMWPAVAHRFPAMEAAKCHRTWSGLYEQCELDGNAVIGRWNNGLANLYTVAGFSGHGMMHAAGAGRGIAELIVHGAYQTIDLTRLGYERVERNEPYRERGIL